MSESVVSGVFDDADNEACAYHPERPAVSICSVCRHDICFECHQVALSGYAVCRSCNESARASHQTPWQRSTLLDGPLSFFRTAWLVISSPTRFFSSYSVPDRMIRVIAFGILCHVIGAVVGWIWRLLYWDQFDEVMAEQAKATGVALEDQVPLFFAALPLVSLLMFCMQWLAFHFACRVFGERISWRTTAFIVAYASAARLFQFVPPVGDLYLGVFFEVIWFVNVQTTALRLMQVDLMKSMLIVMVAFFASFWFMI